MISVFQARLTGSLTSSAPLWLPACQPPNAPAAGCPKKPIRPASITSIGSKNDSPPNSFTRSASASTSSVAKYVAQTTGWASCISGPTPATFLPADRKNR